MKRKMLIIIFLAVEIFASMHWLNCANFEGKLSSYDLGLRLIADIHNDQGVLLWQTRIFHNKVLGTSTDIFNLYIKYWSLPFLISLISPIGTLGLFGGFYYWIQSKKKPLILWILLSYLFAAPFLEIFIIMQGAFPLRVMIVTLPYILWSLFGFYQWNKTETKNKLMLFIVFSIISFSYILIIRQFPNFCPVS